MSTLDTGLTLIRTATRRVSAANGWMGNAFKGWMPTGLYARALLIMIVPMVVLQSVVTFVFMERHWNTVTRHLSAAVVQDIASLIDVYQTYPHDKDRAQLRRIAPRRRRGAPRRARLPRDEGAHRAHHRAAHRDAGRRQPRSAHHPDPLQAGTGPDRRQSRGRRHAPRRRRDVRHARGLSRLCPRRF